MKLTNEKNTILEEKRLKAIERLKNIPITNITKYDNSEMDSILYDIEPKTNIGYSPRGFGIRLKNDMTLYLLIYDNNKNDLIDETGEMISTAKNNIKTETLALKELGDYYEEKINEYLYNKTIEKLDCILQNI